MLQCSRCSTKSSQRDEAGLRLSLGFNRSPSAGVIALGDWSHVLSCPVAVPRAGAVSKIAPLLERVSVTLDPLSFYLATASGASLSVQDLVLALPESPPSNYQPQLGPGVKPLLKGFASERYSGHQLTDHAPPMSSGIPTPNEIFGSAPASRKIQAGLKPLIVIPD